MEDRELLTVRRVVSDFAVVDMSALTARTRFSELEIYDDDLEEVFDRCGEELGVSGDNILDTMPDYRPEAGELTMNSWRNLAPFSPRAAMLLAAHDVPVDDDTLGSLAESLRRGVHVPSGAYLPSENTPRSKRYVVGWGVGIVGAAIACAFGLALLPCDSACRACADSTWQAMTEALPITLGIAMLVEAIAFVPGLVGLWRWKDTRRGRADAAHGPGTTPDASRIG